MAASYNHRKAILAPLGFLLWNWDGKTFYRRTMTTHPYHYITWRQTFCGLIKTKDSTDGHLDHCINLPKWSPICLRDDDKFGWSVLGSNRGLDRGGTSGGLLVKLRCDVLDCIPPGLGDSVNAKKIYTSINRQ
jgi:hypothetical protein